MLPPEQQAGDDGTDDADNDVEDDALLGVGSHDEACKPAANTADDQPDDYTHELFPSCFVAVRRVCDGFAASQTRDAPRLFRIREGLSSFMVAGRAAKRRGSWIGARQ